MKPPLIMLHGSNGCAAEMAGLAKALQPHAAVTASDLLGHGGRSVPDGYTLADMADDLLGELTDSGPSFLLGYSLGGYLALYLARHHPELVRGVVCIAVKHVFDARGVGHVVYLAEPARLARPGNPRKAEMERAHGAANWEQVSRNTQLLFQRMGEAPPLKDGDLRAIAAPVLCLSGDLDSLVPLGEFRQLAASLPNARAGLWPGSAHPIRKVPLRDAAREIAGFVREVEAGTFTPGPPRKLGPDLVSGGLEGSVPSFKFRRDTPTP